VIESEALRSIHTVSHSKDNARLLYCGLDLKTMLDRCSHRLLAQNIISLRSKRHNQLGVHMVLNGYDNSICQTFSKRLDGLSRGFVKLFPRFKCQLAVNTVLARKMCPRFGSRLCNCYYPAFCGLLVSKPRIALNAEID
jgi:hypothetical protein